MEAHKSVSFMTTLLAMHHNGGKIRSNYLF